MSSAPVKLALHWLGGLFALGGVAFVAKRLYGYAPQLSMSNIDAATVALMALLVLVYAAATLLLARAWWNLLSASGTQTEWRWAVKVYGISQLAKYVPGNIFHLAGRQSLGMSAGVQAASLAKSTVWELGLIAVVGSLFVILASPLLMPDLPSLVAVGAFVAVSSGFAWVLKRRFTAMVLHAYGYQMAFLAATGGVFLVSLGAMQDGPLSPGLWLPIGAAYVVAWLLGLVVPGAPAGIGVREASLMFLLSAVAAPVPLLSAVVLSRLITVLGDTLVFLLATGMSPKGLGAGSV